MGGPGGDGPSPRPLTRRRKVAFTAALLGLAALGGEVVLRVRDRVRGVPAYERFTQGRLPLLEPHPFLGYRLRGGLDLADPAFGGRRIRTNRLGFRGREFLREKRAGTVRIACLGGSTTFGWRATDDDRTYPASLERSLNGDGRLPRCEVVNAGAPAYTSLHSLINLETRVLDLSPDIAILCHANNDLVPIFLPPLEPDYTNWWRPFPAHRLPERRTLLERSELFLFLRNQWLRLAGEGEVSPQGTVARRPGAVHPSFPQGQTRVFERNLRSFVAVCRAHGIAPVLMTQNSVLMDPGERGRAVAADPYLTVGPEGNRVAVEAYVEGMDAMNDTTRRVAGETGALLIDGREFGVRASEFADPIHLNDAGEEALGAFVAQALRRGGVIRE